MASRTRRAATAAALLTLALGAGACGDDDEDEGPAGGPAASTTEATPPADEVKQLAVAITENGKGTAYALPATVEAGSYEITVTNNGKKPHTAGIVGVDGEHDAADVVEAVENSEESGIPAWLHGAGGTDRVAPGATATVIQKLDPGTYVLLDDGDEGEDATVADTKTFTVTGEPVTAELPEAPASIVMNEYSFVPSGLKAGKNTILIDNAGKELHHTLAFPIAPGKTIADVRKFATTEGEGSGPPPIDFEGGVGTAVLDGGFKQVVEFDLKAGKYALICFLPDRAGGPPHVAKGMLTELDVK